MSDNSVAQAVGTRRKLLHVPKYDKWDDVFLTYQVDWPLHLLLTPQVGPAFNLLLWLLLSYSCSLINLTCYLVCLMPYWAHAITMQLSSFCTVSLLSCWGGVKKQEAMPVAHRAPGQAHFPNAIHPMLKNFVMYVCSVLGR